MIQLLPVDEQGKSDKKKTKKSKVVKGPKEDTNTGKRKKEMDVDQS